MKKQKNGSNQELNETQINQLKQYAEQVNQLHTEIQSNDKLSIQHSKVALELAFKAGKILNEAKELLKHGDWKKWLSENVTSISIRTIQNYMRLAKTTSKEQYVALLADDEATLRKAYMRVGIIKENPKAVETVPEIASTETPNPDSSITEPLNTEPVQKAVSPQKMKETDAGKYKAQLDEARQKCIAHVRETIEAEKRLDWNLSSWTVKNNKPCSGDETNYAAQLFHLLREWIAKREYSSLVLEDEVMTKAGIVLAEVVKAIILASNPITTGADLTVKLMEFKDVAVPTDRQLLEVPELEPV